VDKRCTLAFGESTITLLPEKRGSVILRQSNISEVQVQYGRS
jgi:hypothetical protein